jgi:hypothetical protein
MFPFSTILDVASAVAKTQKEHMDCNEFEQITKPCFSVDFELFQVCLRVLSCQDLIPVREFLSLFASTNEEMSLIENVFSHKGIDDDFPPFFLNAPSSVLKL